MTTIPVQISIGLSIWKPWMNSWPSPPVPISAPTLTSEMFETPATRSPAMIAGSAIGSSTANSRRVWR